MGDSFSTASGLTVNGQDYRYYSLEKLGQQHDISRLPFSLKILLENLLRHEDGVDVTRSDIEALCNWDPTADPSTEIALRPPGYFCRTLPACRQSSTWQQCAMP